MIKGSRQSQVRQFGRNLPSETSTVDEILEKLEYEDDIFFRKEMELQANERNATHFASMNRSKNQELLRRKKMEHVNFAIEKEAFDRRQDKLLDGMANQTKLLSGLVEDMDAVEDDRADPHAPIFTDPMNT